MQSRGQGPMKNVWKTKYNHDKHISPYTITAVNKDNGAATAHKGRVMDLYNIHNITPYRE